MKRSSFRGLLAAEKGKESLMLIRESVKRLEQVLGDPGVKLWEGIRCHRDLCTS